MIVRPIPWLLCALLFGRPATAPTNNDPRRFVQQAVQAELAADRDDHTHWIYFESDRKSEHVVKQWVAETSNGNLRLITETDGRPIPADEQRKKMDSFVNNSSAQSRQRKAEQHDDQQATEMLRLLPQAFIWTNQGEKGNSTILHFRPDPQFHAPDLESRVFAAMEGDMAVDTQQHRIVSLKGRLIHDVKIAGGWLGSLDSGGTFDVERRETGKSVWQITETHVHIHGRALIFKSISEQEDDVKSEFRQLSANVSLQQAEQELLKTRK